MDNKILNLLPSLTYLTNVTHTALYIVIAALLFSQPVHAQPSLEDVTPNGWTRATDLTGIKIDQYKTVTGSMSIELVAFPPTDQSAAQWIDNALSSMLKKARDANRQTSIVNDDDADTLFVQGQFNSSSAGADIATRTITLHETKSGDEKLTRIARAIVRKGQPVQFSLLSLSDATANNSQWQQVNALRFNANLPYNTSAAFLGLDKMMSIMTGPLLYLDKSTKNPATNTAQSKPAKSKPAMSKPAKKLVTKTTGNRAPTFSKLPGPQVQLTGTWLKNLPAGFRMRTQAKHYWVNSAMTKTRTRSLVLTADGQFETGSFAIMSGMGGMASSVFSHDKDGSTGATFGNTDPDGHGSNTTSTAISKREGVDPSKYGAYNISGNTIEFRYANVHNPLGREKKCICCV